MKIVNTETQELLNYALKNGMIDLDTIRMQKEMKERKEYLEKHPYKIWQGKSNKFYTYVPDSTKKEGRRQIQRTTRESLEDFLVQQYKKDEQEPYFRDLFYEWAKNKLTYGEIFKQTYDRYETDFRRFFKNSPLWNIRFRNITEELLEEVIRTTIHDMNLSSKGWANMRTLINGMFKYAKKKGYTSISITHFMGDLDLSKKAFCKIIRKDEDNVFTPEEVAMITERINAAEPSLINLGILLAFQTGLRRGELAGLKYSDLNGKILTVSRTEVRYKDADGKYIFEVRECTKGEDGRRAVVMTPEAIEIIKKARRMSGFEEYLFTSNGTRIKANAFTKKLYRICEQLNINARSLHQVRKTYGTKLLKSGINEKVIQRQMGHLDINTTKGFYYFSDLSVEAISREVSCAINEEPIEEITRIAMHRP